MGAVGCMALYYGGTGLLACIQAIELVCCLRSCPCRRRAARALAPRLARQGNLPELKGPEGKCAADNDFLSTI